MFSSAVARTPVCLSFVENRISRYLIYPASLFSPFFLSFFSLSSPSSSSSIDENLSDFFSFLFLLRVFSLFFFFLSSLLLHLSLSLSCILTSYNVNCEWKESLFRKRSFRPAFQTATSVPLFLGLTVIRSCADDVINIWTDRRTPGRFPRRFSLCYPRQTELPRVA